MTARTPLTFTGMADGAFSADHKLFLVRIETAESSGIDIAIPITEIGRLVTYLVGVPSHLATIGMLPKNEPETNTKLNFSPIPIYEIGLAPTNEPSETMLVVRLAAGFDLAFPLDSKKLSELGREFARNAETLSADHAKPQ
jgi:hypothetical protein